jgi:hypothetical protein
VKISGVHHQPQGPAFDLVLLLHVACVVVGLATTVAGAATATRLRKVLASGIPLPEALARYFRPGVNWAGRAIYGIPVFGFVLLAMSRGAYGLRDGWVMGGLALVALVVMVAEGTWWPAERRLQVSLVPYGAEAVAVAEPVRRDARVMALSATLALVLLVAGTVLMVAQP